jgi:hypothetical protein
MDKSASIEEDERFWRTTKFAGEVRNYDFVRNNCGSKTIDIEIVKKFIDEILDFPETEFFDKFVRCKDALIMDFIGGDSLQYPELLDEILTYLVRRMAEKNHVWMTSWRSSLSSNGVSLLNPAARKFCEKWKDNLSLGLQ